MTIHNAIGSERIKQVLSKNQFPPTVALNNFLESDFKDAIPMDTSPLKNLDLLSLKEILKRSPFRSTGIITRDFPKNKPGDDPFVITTEGTPYKYRNYGSGYIQSQYKPNQPISVQYGWNHNPEGLSMRLDDLVVESQTAGYYLTSRYDGSTGKNNYKAIALDRPFAKSVAGVYFLPVQKEMGGFMKKIVKKAYVQFGKYFDRETDKNTQYVLILKGSFGLPGSKPSTDSTMPKDYIYLELPNQEDILVIVKLLKMADHNEISSRDLLAYLLWDEQRARKIIESNPEEIRLNPILTENNLGVHFIIPKELEELTN